MTISSLNQRAQLLANTLTPDGGGGFGEAWEAFASVWIALDAAWAAATRSVPTGWKRACATGSCCAAAPTSRRAARPGGRAHLPHPHRLDEGPGAALMTLLCEELP